MGGPIECLRSYNSISDSESCPIRQLREHAFTSRLTRAHPPREVAPSVHAREKSMQMLNHHCGIDRDSRGVVRLSICNAGSLNILGSAVINAVREGLEQLAADRTIRALVLAGQSEKSMI